MSALSEAALGYAKRGWHVFPVYEPRDGRCSCGLPNCASPAKHPRNEHGLLEASTDPHTIAAWWRKWPNASIGIATEPSGLVVLDVDVKSGGEESLEHIIAKYGRVDDTMCVLTGGGGQHYYFAAGSSRLTSRVAALGSDYSGIDIRAAGGYVVAPPSLHITGGAYAWEASNPDVPFTVPEWLVLATSNARRARSAAVASDSKIADGQRNSALTSLAGSMRRKGSGQLTISAALHVENEQRCELPLPKEEVDKIAASVSRYAPLEAAESAEQKASQADRLVTLALATGMGCLRDGASAYARIRNDNGSHAIYRMKSPAFTSWLCRLMYNAEKKAPNGASVTDARNVLEGVALHDPSSEVADVSLRVAQSSEDIVLDLGDDTWRCVRISGDGYRVEPHDAMRFRRSNTTSALPEPVPGGDLRNLRRFVRCDDESWPLIAAWLIAAVRPKGPYPILVLTGEQGSSKTTTARMLRSIVDPSDLAVRSEPRDAMDLMIAARHSHIVALDNLSRVSPQIADALCCLSTGGGFAKRELYSDAEESVVAVSRPIILTAIEDVATRGDLLDRALVVRLRSIPENERRTERELWERFERDRAELLSAVCSAASLALRREPEIKQAGVSLARMADFHAWSLAAESAYAEGISFDLAYRASRESSHRLAIEDSILADPLRQLLRSVDAADQERVWHGTATQLLEALGSVTSDETRRRKKWPRSAQALANALRRIAPALRALGLEIDQDRRSHGGVRTIHLSLGAPLLRKEAQASSPSSPNYEKAHETGDFSGDDARDPSSPERHQSSPIVTSTPGTVVTHREPGDDVVTTQKQVSSPEKTPPRRGLRRSGDDGDDTGPLLPKEVDVREGDEVCLLLSHDSRGPRGNPDDVRLSSVVSGPPTTDDVRGRSGFDHANHADHALLGTQSRLSEATL